MAEESHRLYQSPARICVSDRTVLREALDELQEAIHLLSPCHETASCEIDADEAREAIRRAATIVSAVIERGGEGRA